MEAFSHLREAYRSKESVRQLCNEAGITAAAVEGAPMQQPYGMMWFMHGLVRAGRDSDADLLLLFGPGKKGAQSLPKLVSECREQVRQVVVLPMGSGPGTPSNTMHGYYINFFAHLPYKPRQPDADEVTKAQDFARNVKEFRDMMKQSDTPTRVACIRCGRAEIKLLQCGGCGMVKYCSRDCQREDWPNHKVQCKFVTNPPQKKG